MTRLDSVSLEALRKSEDRLRLLLDTLPHGVQRSDCRGVITYSNRAHHSILGWEPGELLGKKIWDVLPTEEERRSLQQYLEVLVRDQPPPVPYVARNRRRDGSPVDLQVDWSYERDAAGDLTGFISVITDISERRTSEEQLRERTEGLATLLDVTQNLAGTLDTERVLQAAVDGVTELTGLDTSAIYLLRGDQLDLRATHPPLPPGFPRELRAARLADHPHIRKAIVSGESVLLPDMSKEELTPAERSVAEQRNLRTVLYLPLIADGLAEGIFIVGSVLEPVMLSHSVVDLARTLANLSALTVRSAQLFEEGQERSAQLEQSLKERIEAEAERKALQAQLIQAQKMESVGRLAGGMAHDFNNMLAVILGHADLALGALDSEDPLHAHLTEILTAAERSSNLIRQLLGFARKQTIDPQLLVLNDVVGAMLKMMRRLIGEDIELSWRPDPELGAVRLDPAQVDQILANLCVNARDAISGTGKITIETANRSFDSASCAERPGFRPGAFVMVAVSDDGAGMDKETLEMVFEPFFTTKEAGKGTGLGLSTVYGIVMQNEGFVNVYSEPGQGTTVKVYLPRQEAVGGAARAGRAEQILQGGDETVLLVEDEEIVLRLVREMLESLGYRVVAASSPNEALELAGEHAGTIDLLVTDVVMPGLNGLALSESLERLFPELRTLFVSGYTAEVIARHGILDEGVRLLSKPFSKKELATKVREALTGGRGGCPS